MAINKNELPSERATREAEERVKRQAERAEAEGRFAGVIARLSNTEDGREFFRWLKKECGWGESFLGVNPASQEIDPQRTVYQAMRLNLYWKVRSYLPLKQRIEVEDV